MFRFVSLPSLNFLLRRRTANSVRPTFLGDIYNFAGSWCSVAVILIWAMCARFRIADGDVLIALKPHLTRHICRRYVSSMWWFISGRYHNISLYFQYCIHVHVNFLKFQPNCFMFLVMIAKIRHKVYVISCIIKHSPVNVFLFLLYLFTFLPSLF
jgi:hypothetical protein